MRVSSFFAILANLACVESISSNKSDSNHKEEAAIPGFLRTKGKSITDYKEPLNLDVHAVMAKVPEDHASMDLRKRAELVGDLAEKLQQTMDEINEYDLSDFPAIMEAVETAKHAVDGAVKPISDSIYFMNAEADAKEMTSGREESDKDVTKPLTSLEFHMPLTPMKQQRRAKEANGGRTGPVLQSSEDIASQEYQGDGRRHRYYGQRTEDGNAGKTGSFFGSDEGAPEDKSSQEDQGHDWRHHYFGHRHKYTNMKSSARHQHSQKIQDAVLNGDHDFMNGMLNSFHTQATRHSSRRRRMEQGHRDLKQEKKKHCKQLTRCAHAMSMYDVFVYFYSDDIDPETGEIDDVVAGFDEMSADGNDSGIEKKYNAIHAKADELWPNYGNGGIFDCRDSAFEDKCSQLCDELLEQFHRSVEVNGHPEWEGAFVSQVCFAEGTQAFVRLTDILLKLATDVPLPETVQESTSCYLVFSCDESTDDVSALVGHYDQLLAPYAIEILFCARDLFFALENPHNEFFPFLSPQQAFYLERFGFNQETMTTLVSTDDLDNFGFPYSYNMNKRDEHGRMVDLAGKLFYTSTYTSIQGDFKTCLENGMEKLRNDCNDQLSESSDKADCREDGLKDVVDSCISDYADPIQESIELVFGERASTGFICGLKDAVINDGKSLPGRCCLNAPFQLNGDSWGYEYDCNDTNNECRDGPILSGISEASCRVYGGFFCPTPDCTDLRDCVDDEIKYADENNLPVYKNWLESSYLIEDVNSQYDCGRAREYFGFQENFIDDNAICEDITQLRYSDDFEFMKDFFKQGDDGGVDTPGGGGCGNSGGDTDLVGCIPPLALTAPSRTKSEEASSIAGEWESSIFVLSQVIATLEFVVQAMDFVECPCDPTCASSNICGAMKMFVIPITATLVYVIRLIFEISTFSYAQSVELSDDKITEDWENTNAIFPNMEAIGAWLEDRMEYLYLETTCVSVEELVPGHGCDGIVNLCSTEDSILERVPDSCSEDEFPPQIDFSRVEELCSPEKHVFPSGEMGRQCVEKHVKATDDCYQTTVEVKAKNVDDSELTPTCGKMKRIEVTATEDRCEKSTTRTFDVLVDTDAAISYCRFAHSPETPPKLDVRTAIEKCSSTTVFASLDAALACVELYADVSDDCRETKVKVSTTDSTDASSTCGTTSYQVEVIGKVQFCSLSTTQNLQVHIDPTLNSPSCQFSQDLNLKPILDISAAVNFCGQGQIFQSAEEAEACVVSNTKASDASGCRPVETAVSISEGDPIMTGCGTVEFKFDVTAAVSGCSQLTTSESMHVFVDPNIAVSKCELTADPSTGPLLDISKAIEDCGNGHIFQTYSEAEACVLGSAVSKDASGCRPVDVDMSTTTKGSVMSGCSTNSFDIKVKSSPHGCSALGITTEASMTILVDTNIEVSKCASTGSTTSAPLLDISQAIELCSNGQIFQSWNDAKACVETNTVSKDAAGCRSVSMDLAITSEKAASSGCGTAVYDVAVSTQVKNCAGSNAQESLTILVDESMETSQCTSTGSTTASPLLDVSQAAVLCGNGQIFQSWEDAKACVEGNISSKDAMGCRSVSTDVSMTSETPVVDGCGTQTVDMTITTAVSGCSESRTTEKMTVLVDPNIQVTTCSFSQGPAIPPVLDVSQAMQLCNEEQFETLDEAKACVLGNAFAEDVSSGCRTVSLSVSSKSVNDLCQHEIAITAQIEGCQGLQSVSPPIVVTVDDEAPVTSCWFTLDTESDDDLVNPGLSYKATDNCGAPLQVTIEGSSNEMEDSMDSSKSRMLLMYEEPQLDGDDDGEGNTRIGWYVANEVCSSKDSGKCMYDPGIPGTRIYKARITATDTAGFKASSDCYFEIVDEKAKRRRLVRQRRQLGSKSSSSDEEELLGIPTQFFALTSYSFPSYIPDAIVPTARD